MDEPTILAALADDLDIGFEALVRARQDRVYSIALRILGVPADAEDAAQDAFVRAYRALGGWDAPRILALRLDAWLATIVVNVARTRVRRRGTTSGRSSLTFLDELDHPTAAPGETPAARLEARESTGAWASRLLALPERYRGPVVLRHVDGLGYDEIALALDRPEGTVKAQVHRGLARLREMLLAEPSPDAGHDPAATSARPSGPTAHPRPILQETHR